MIAINRSGKIHCKNNIETSLSKCKLNILLFVNYRKIMKHKFCLLIAFVSFFSTSVQAKDLVDTLNSVDNGLQKLQNSIQQSKRQIRERKEKRERLENAWNNMKDADYVENRWNNYLDQQARERKQRAEQRKRKFVDNLTSDLNKAIRDATNTH